MWSHTILYKGTHVEGTTLPGRVPSDLARGTGLNGASALPARAAAHRHEY